jgi:uncharacterized protein
MTSTENSINWFEISVADIDRAKKFYETIFDIKMQTQNLANLEMAFFPYEPGSGKASGGLVKSKMHKPSADGVKLYLNGNPDLSVPLSKVENAGGKVIVPKTQITDEFGYMAFFIDTEGNTVALHSQK